MAKAKDRAPQRERWRDGTPKSSNNAFTGQGYTVSERDSAPPRSKILNGMVPNTIPWNGPYTQRQRGVK